MHFVCDVKSSTWPKPRSCHRDSRKAQVERHFLKSTVRLPGDLSSTRVRHSLSAASWRHSQQSDPFQPQQSSTTYRRMSCAAKKQNTFRVILKSSNFICWSIPLLEKKGGGVLYLIAPDKRVLSQKFLFKIYFCSSLHHPTSSFFVLVAFIYINFSCGFGTFTIYLK